MTYQNERRFEVACKNVGLEATRRQLRKWAKRLRALLRTIRDAFDNACEEDYDENKWVAFDDRFPLAQLLERVR